VIPIPVLDYKVARAGINSILQSCLRARVRLNQYDPPLSYSLPIRMGIVVARIEAWTVRSSLHDGIL
jgi:hypothetical protein